jgi:hypothetical protein
VTSGDSPSGLVPGENLVHRPARALIGWVNSSEAVRLLLGHNPGPNDETGGLAEQAAECREAVEARPPYEEVDPLIPDHPLVARLDDVAARPAVQAAFHGMQWRSAVVDLTKVLSFQKLVFTDREMTSDGPLSETELLELCLPSEQPVPPVGAIGDPDGKGFTISSLNTNLRIAAGQVGEAVVAPAPDQPSVKMQAITLLVSMGTSYLQVARYRSRALLRDGYHRAASLLQAGVTAAPAIFIEARSFEEVQPPPGALPYEILFGVRPPALTDYWDDSVSRAVRQLAVRKVIRVRGEEFAVPR